MNKYKLDSILQSKHGKFPPFTHFLLQKKRDFFLISLHLSSCFGKFFQRRFAIENSSKRIETEDR